MPSVSPATSKLCHLPLPTLYDLLAPVTVRAGSPRARFTNWGLTYTCTPLAVFEPENELQCIAILELARREGKTLRVVGLGHSPSDLACTSEFMMRTERLDRVLEVRPVRFVSSRFFLSLSRSLAPSLPSLSRARSLARFALALSLLPPGTLPLFGQPCDLSCHSEISVCAMRHDRRRARSSFVCFRSGTSPRSSLRAFCSDGLSLLLSCISPKRP